MDELNDKQNDWVLSLLKLQPNDKVLEIGYGTGLTIQKASKKIKKGKIYGIDVSKTMLNEASKCNETLIKSGRVEVKVADASNIPFETNFFDKIFAVHVVYFWPDISAVFKEIYRVAKPKGFLALYLVHPIIAKNKFFNSYTPKEIISSLNRVGFNKVKKKMKKFGKQQGICIFAYK